MGTRLPFQTVKTRGKDHPHAYGDKLGFPIACCVAMGSSPRVWGQVNGAENKSDVKGIIPTRMGTRKQLFPPFRGCRDHPHAYGDK